MQGAEVGLEATLVTWCALLNAYADSSMPLQAVETLKRMRQLGFEPSVQASSRHLRRSPTPPPQQLLPLGFAQCDMPCRGRTQ